MSLWWPKLARLADLDPPAVVELTTLIIERHARDEFYRVRIADVSAIARVGLSSGQAGVRRAAERLVHLLGERDYDDVGQLLGLVPERHAHDVGS
jgi:polyphosphate kinase